MIVHEWDGEPCEEAEDVVLEVHNICPHGNYVYETY